MLVLKWPLSCVISYSPFKLTYLCGPERNQTHDAPRTEIYSAILGPLAREMFGLAPSLADRWLSIHIIVIDEAIFLLSLSWA